MHNTIISLLALVAFLGSDLAFAGASLTYPPGPSGSGTSTGTNTGDVTLGTFGSTPAAKGASLSGQVLTLQPADGTHPGSITSGTQTLGGIKSFDANVYIGSGASAIASTPVRVNGTDGNGWVAAFQDSGSSAGLLVGARSGTPAFGALGAGALALLPDGGPVLVGKTTDDSSGAILQVNGAADLTGVLYLDPTSSLTSPGSLIIGQTGGALQSVFTYGGYSIYSSGTNIGALSAAGSGEGGGRISFYQPVSGQALSLFGTGYMSYAQQSSYDSHSPSAFYVDGAYTGGAGFFSDAIHLGSDGTLTAASISTSGGGTFDSVTASTILFPAPGSPYITVDGGNNYRFVMSTAGGLATNQNILDDGSGNVTLASAATLSMPGYSNINAYQATLNSLAIDQINAATAGGSNVEVYAGNLRDASNQYSVKWAARTLNDSGGTTTIDWENRVLSSSWTVNGRSDATPAYLPFSGNLTSIVTNQIVGYGKATNAATIQSMQAVASGFTCVSNPTFTLYDCGTSASACTSGRTALAAVTLTAANTGTDGTISSSALAAGHYWAVELTGGTCTTLNAVGTAQYN